MSEAVEEYREKVGGRLGRDMREHLDNDHSPATCILCDPDNETCVRCGRVFVHDFFMKCRKGTGEHVGDGKRVKPKH